MENQDDSNLELLADGGQPIDVSELMVLRAVLIPQVKERTLERDVAFKQFHELALKLARPPVASMTDIRVIMSVYQNFMDDLDRACWLFGEGKWKKGYFEATPDGSLWDLYKKLRDIPGWRDMNHTAPAQKILMEWVEKENALLRRSLEHHPLETQLESATDQTRDQSKRPSTIPEDQDLPADPEAKESSAANPSHISEHVMEQSRAGSEDSHIPPRRISQPRKWQNKWKNLKDKVRGWFRRRRGE